MRIYIFIDVYIYFPYMHMRNGIINLATLDTRSFLATCPSLVSRADEGMQEEFIGIFVKLLSVLEVPYLKDCS